MTAGGPRLARARKEAIPVAWAAASTAYWCACGTLYMVTMGSFLVLLLGWASFLLLLWGLATPEARPSRFAWVAATLSLFYTHAAAFIVGMAAYIEGHGCAIAEVPCDGDELGLMWQALIAALLLYFAAAWAIVRWRAASRGKAAPEPAVGLREKPPNGMEAP